MILSLKYYREFGWFKTLRIAFSGALKHLFQVGASARRRKKALSQGLAIPRLKKNGKGNTLCISCGLCAQICPSKAISIEVDPKIQFPKSLQTGPEPKAFLISEDLCIRCSLCVEACPVDALGPCSQEL